MKYPSPQRLKEISIASVFLVIVIAVVSLITPYRTSPEYLLFDSSKTTTQQSFLRAEVVKVEDDTISAKLLDSLNKGTTVTIESNDDTTQQRVHEGSIVTLQQNQDQSFAFYDTYRVPAIIILAALFVLAVAFTGRGRGLMSLAGLAASVLIIVGVTIPLLIRGWDSFWVTVGSAYLIAIVSVILAHGLRRQTYISLACILCVLTFVALASTLLIFILGLTGIVDEASYSLQARSSAINLSGVLTGGIVIATLGALDDVVTTQVATVAQIYSVNKKLTRTQVYSRAIAVGGEHIAALVNTLALVYVGASLPLVVVYSMYFNDPIAFLNTGFIATELTRTLIVSTALVLSVPFSTWLATKAIIVRSADNNTSNQ